MKWLLIFALIWTIGCISEETKQLAQGIYLYQAKQQQEIKEISGAAVSSGASSDLFVNVLTTQEALVRSTKALSEILGKPEKEVTIP